MNTIQVEQAVFASSERGSVKGYQLVAKSAGIDRSVSQELCRWAPTQFPSHDPEQWTINYFPVGKETVAITRTVLGGPEYSGRGGTQVVTLILLLRNEQFLSYGCNAIVVAKTALAMGYLNLPLIIGSEPLPQAVLPSEPFLNPSCSSESASEDDAFTQLFDHVNPLLNDYRRVAVIGLSDPMDALAHLIPKLSIDARWDLSFTTGLSPAAGRPFRMHFLSSVDMTKKLTLDAQNIVPVEAK